MLTLLGDTGRFAHLRTYIPFGNINTGYVDLPFLPTNTIPYYLDSRIDLSPFGLNSSVYQDKLEGCIPSVDSGKYVQAFNAWSTYAVNIQKFFSDWDFSAGANASDRENPIVHMNVRGNCLSGNLRVLPENSWSALHVNLDPVHFTEEWFLAQPSSSTLVTKISLENETFGNYLIEYDELHTEPYCLHLRVGHTWFDGTYWQRRIHYVRYSAIFVSFKLGISDLVDDSIVSLPDFFNLSVKREIMFVWGDTFLPGYGSEPSHYHYQWNEDFIDPFIDDYGFGATYLSNRVGAVGNIRGLTGWNSPGDFPVEHNYSFSIFRQLVAKYHQSCYAGNVMSYNAAVSAYFSSIRSDHIEFLAELKDILGPLDILKGLVYLSRRPLTFSSLWRLLKLIANAKLCYSLGIAPTLSDAVETSEKLPRIIEKFSTMFSVGISRGSATIDIYDADFPGLEATVTCHSKVKIGIEPDSYLPYFMFPRALGLLPSLSSMWNLVPYSFVVDWFLPIGDGIEAVESSSLYLMAQVYPSAHSIVIDNDLTSHLDDHGLATSDVDAFVGYRYYERYIMGHLFPCPTLLPWYGGSGVIPDWGTAGALVFQRIS